MAAVGGSVQRFADGRIGPALRYVAVSLINVVNHQAVLWVANSLWGWPGGWANAFAASVALVPAYLLTKAWVWSTGPGAGHSVSREVAPFFALAVIGLVVSSALAGLADAIFGSGLWVNAASLAGYVVVWIAKFFILERIFNP